MVETAWASASTFRGSDIRGGANGARIRLAPQKDWAVKRSQQLSFSISKIDDINKDFNNASSGKKPMAVIVLAGNVGIEMAEVWMTVRVPFHPGRGDATEEQTDVGSFNVMEPLADGFRNYFEN